MMKRRAQSILEYIIVLSAITAAVIAMAQNVIRPSVNTMFNDAGKLMTDSSGQLRDQAAR